MSRQGLLQLARAGFTGLALALAWWSFRGRWDEIWSAVLDVGVPRVVLASAAAGLGLVLTARLWRLLLGWLGSPIGAREAAAVFLVGQLGKYLPGSVWSVAAQAQLGRRHGVPARSSATASLLFLLVHTATGLLFGGLLALAGAVAVPPTASHLWLVAAVLIGAVSLTPPLLHRVAARLAGHGARADLGWSHVGRAVALMALVWISYGACLWALVPVDGVRLPAAVAAFALAHAVGVVIVLAPAGVGAREAVLVALLAPVAGVPAAVAAALLSRVVHAGADVALAAIASARAARPGMAEQPEVGVAGSSR